MKTTIGERLRLARAGKELDQAVLAEKAGLHPLQIGLMSVLVFAGSAQFIAVSMLPKPMPSSNMKRSANGMP